MKPVKKAEKNAMAKAHKIALGIIAGVAGVATVAFTFQDGLSLSRFTQSIGVNSQNASSLWQPSPDNPHRSKLNASYASRLDALTVAILNKGKPLSKDAFATYLNNLNSGIVALGGKPAYASNEEVQNIIKYLAYEVGDAAGGLEGVDALMAELDSFVESN